MAAYASLNGKLTITAVGAHDLLDVRFLSTMAPMITMEINNLRQESDPCKGGGVKPSWHHTFAPLDLSHADPQQAVSFEILDGKSPVGNVQLSLDELLQLSATAKEQMGGVPVVHLKLCSAKDPSKFKGELTLAVRWSPTPAPVQQHPPPLIQQQTMPLQQHVSMPMQPPPLMPQGSFVNVQVPMQPQAYYPPPQACMQQQQPIHYAAPAQAAYAQPPPAYVTPDGQAYYPASAQPPHPHLSPPQPQQGYYAPQPVLSAPPPQPQPMWPQGSPQSEDDGVIPFSELTFTRLIGDGTFGTVSAGEFRSTPVAIKQLKQNVFSQQQWEEFMSEVKFLKEARHPNIVLFMGVCLNPYCIVTELLDTSLFNILHKERRALSPQQTHHIAISIARGLASLHGRPIPVVHRDIKSLNILVSNDLVSVKICDLGMVKLKAGYGTRLEQNGTPLWMAPEVLLDQPYDEQADVFSYGCVLFEILTHSIPFGGGAIPKEELVRRVGQQGERPKLPSGMDRAWKDLLVQCWQQHPQARPTMKQVVATLQAMKPA